MRIPDYPAPDRPLDGSELVPIWENGQRAIEISALAAILPPGPPGSPGDGFATRSAIAALTPTDGFDVYLTEAGREGKFVFRAINLSAMVTADPQQGIFIAPASDPTGASGAWRRTGWAALDIRYFGAKVDNTTNDGVPVSSAWAFSYATRRIGSYAGIDYGNGAGVPVYVPGGTYVGSTTLTVNHSFKFEGDSVGLPAAATSFLRWDAGVTGIEIDNSGFNIDSVFLIAAFTGVEGEHHAIRATRTFSYRNIGGGDWGGDFMNLDCSGGGNVNGVVGENVWVYNCRTAYRNKSGSDNSADSHQNWNVDSCRELGFDERTFLGTRHEGHQVAFCGLTAFNDGASIPCSFTAFGGNRYTAIAGQETWCSTHAPSGTTDDNQGWAFIGAGGANTAFGIIGWFSGILVRLGGSYYCNGVNIGSEWIGCYGESPQLAQICTPSIVISPAMALWKGSPTFVKAAYPQSDRGYLRNDNGFEANAYSGTDETVSVALGEPSNSQKTIWQVTSPVSYPLTLRCMIDPNGAGDIGRAYGGGSLYNYETGPNTNKQFGTGAPVPFANFFSKLMVGSDVNQARLMTNGAAAPTTGAHARGEICWNVTPAVGQPEGWRCTVAGTPGTWASMGGEIIDLRDFGAALNGIDDDLAAFTAAVAALGSNGGTIEWDGYLRFNSGYTAPAGKSIIRLKPRGFSPFYNPVHGFTFLTLPNTVALWELDRVSFFTDTGASGAGEVFLLDSACDNLVTRDLYGLNIWSGLRLTGTKQFIEGRTYFQENKPSSGRFCVIDQGTNEICEIENLVGLNGSDCAVGVEILSGNAVKLGGTIAKGGVPLKLNPAGGQTIATLVLNDFNGDTSSGHGCWLTGAGTIKRLRGRATFSGCGGTGMLVDNPANSADLWLRLQQNTVNGLTLAGVSHDESRYRVTAYGNGQHGFEALASASKFTIEAVCGAGDGFGGNLGFGGVIGTGCTDFTVNVSGSGNGSGIISNGSGTSATKVVTTRG